MDKKTQKRKIKPAEVTGIQQRVKWEALFRNTEKMGDLKRAMAGKFDEEKIKNILGDIIVDKAAYVDDAKLIWDKFINVRVNLTLPKEIILAEVGELLDRYKKKHKVTTSKRIILNDANEIFQVWGLYQQAGKQPSRVTFRDAARMTGRPLSTIKDQWRKAYEKIYGKKYEPAVKYTTEKKKADADQLCAKCPYDAKCYRGADWKPCNDYLKIAGKEKMVAFTELHDNYEYSED